MRIRVEFDDGEHKASIIKMAEALVRFFFEDVGNVEELGEYLTTWAKHNKDDGKRGDEG